ncbi:tubulin nucleotide-binding domain-like protein, partial [Gonapodya prolifera JEL478]
QTNRQVDHSIPQISTRFWDMVLQEHAKYNEEGLFDESLATFFRHTDDKCVSRNIPLGNGKNRIRELRARAVLIDMEERVINGIRASPQKELFDDRQIVLSNSGSGNNWAMGYKHYGEMYRERISDTVRSEVEMVDTLQSLFTISSTGGGTGSGLGSFVVELLQDEYPGASKFSTVVMPSADDDVVTSPYNSVLALSKLTDSADCILPVENQALIDICKKVDEGKTERQKGTALTDSPVDGMLKKAKPFDTMNNIVANLMINLTSSTRFPGSLNMDINELAVNLVPFPRIRYLLSSMTPLYVLADRKAIPRKIGQMFLDCFSRETQLMKADPRNSTYLGCALLVRGDAEMSDIRRNIDRLKPTLKFIPWNPDGWKVGLCSAAPLNQVSAPCT